MSSDSSRPSTPVSAEQPTSELISAIADVLCLRIVRPLAGGLYGAVLVSGRDGELLVFKVLSSEDLAPVWATGAAMAERVRSTGYPAPKYQGTGSVAGATWSLQEFLPGEV